MLQPNTLTQASLVCMATSESSSSFARHADRHGKVYNAEDVIEGGSVHAYTHVSSIVRENNMEVINNVGAYRYLVSSLSLVLHLKHSR